MSQTVITAPRMLRHRPGTEHLQRWVATVLGAAATGVMLIGAGTPSYWGDEAASVMSAQRPLWSLWQELGHIDVVHGAYYLFLHFWIQVAGASEFATRFPSALAAGVAVGGVVTLGRMLFGMRAGVLAGVLMVAIPEVTRVAIEARSYALSMAIAVWLTVLLAALLRRGETRRRWWAFYTVLLALGIYVFLYLVLLIPVHLAVVAFLATGRRRMLRCWARAVALALVVAMPVVVAGVLQEHQIAFLANKDYASVHAVVVRQWFHNVPLAVLGWSLILAGAALTALRRNLRNVHVVATAVVLAWLVIPTALLLVGNAWITPMYNFRYTGFCLPAVALAMAIGVVRIGDLVRNRTHQSVIQVVVVVVALALAAPVFGAQRGDFAKDGGADLRQTASTVASVAKPGDAVVFDTTVKPSRRPRLALDLYPAAFSGLNDIALVTPYVNRSWIWDRVAPLDAIHRQLSGYQGVVAVEGDRSTSTDLSELGRLGFVVVDERHVHRTTVYRLERGLL